ncbi:MAG: type III secretion protein, partial [Chloroflexi bacterium]
GIKSGPEIARAALALTVTVALYPRWPVITVAEPGLARLLSWMLGEAALGIAIGVCVSFLLESFVFAAQMMGLQAGYAYASTIDPTTQADTGILLLLAQLIAGMFFFAMGLDREVIRIFARTLETFPPGNFSLAPGAVNQVLNLGADMLATGLRLAFPVVALLVLVDVSLALMGRVNAQLQLLTLAFPVKMLVTLLLLAWVSVLMPTVFRAAGHRMLASLHAVMGR